MRGSPFLLLLLLPGLAGRSKALRLEGVSLYLVLLPTLTVFSKTHTCVAAAASHYISYVEPGLFVRAIPILAGLHMRHVVNNVHAVHVLYSCAA